MNRAATRMMVLACTFFVLFVQGCASSNKLFLKQNSPPSGPIKVCRHETPGIMKSTGAETTLLAAITLAAPGGSALLLVGDEYTKARGAGTQSKIPDFGSLVMAKFMSRIQKSQPDWPALTVVPAPLKEDFSEKCAVIEFKVNRVAYGSLDLTRGGIAFERGLKKGIVSKGFLSKTTVTMKDSLGEVLWRKDFIYLSENSGREKSLDELEADDFKLLKEEMEFAAEATVADFIQHLNGEPEKTAQK